MNVIMLPFQQMPSSQSLGHACFSAHGESVHANIQNTTINFGMAVCNHLYLLSFKLQIGDACRLGTDEKDIRQYLVSCPAAHGSCKAKQLPSSSKVGAFSGSELSFQVIMPGESTWMDNTRQCHGMYLNWAAALRF